MAQKGTVEAIRTKRQTFFIGGRDLLVHKFTSKAILQILEKQMKLSSAGREVRNPPLDYVRSLYVLPNERFGMPCRAVKLSMVRGADQTNTMKMTQAKMAFFVDGERVESVFGGDKFIEIVGVPQFHAAMVSNDNGGTDIRFRALFPEWAAKIELLFNEARVTPEQLAQMLVAAGFGVGLAENRPERSGDDNNGTFELIQEPQYNALQERIQPERKAWFEKYADLLLKARAEDKRLYDLLSSDPEAVAKLHEAMEDLGRKQGKNGRSDQEVEVSA